MNSLMDQKSDHYLVSGRHAQSGLNLLKTEQRVKKNFDTQALSLRRPRKIQAILASKGTKSSFVNMRQEV